MASDDAVDADNIGVDPLSSTTFSSIEESPGMTVTTTSKLTMRDVTGMLSKIEKGELHNFDVSYHV